VLKIVQIIPDDRDMFRCYDQVMPFFGPAPTALLEGFASLASEAEIHVIACVRRRMPAPQKLAENIFYHPILIPRGYRRTLFIKAIVEVRKLIQQIRPDVVHGQGTEDYPGLCAAFSGYPNCITVHGNMRAVARRLKYRPFPQMALTALAETVALRKTDAVICNSSYTERCVGRLNKNKVRIPNAVRSSFFSLRSAAGAGVLTFDLRIPPSIPILLCSGTIVSYKNQVGLIHALDEVAKEVGFRLVFVGRLPIGEVYSEKFIRAVNDYSWCEYAGHLELSELQELLRQSSGVIHPTLEDSFGLAVAEAQAAGVPVAASNIGGVPDLIEHGKTGLLFDPNRPDDIREKVSFLLRPEGHDSVSKCAKAYARQQYHPCGVAEKHLHLYLDK
jgi:glycosyltransferase involved in cell wall biosynthesis